MSKDIYNDPAVQAEIDLARTLIPKTSKTYGGRPSKYSDALCELAYKICKNTGATNQQLADIFDVKIETINDWIVNKRNFAKAINKGKVIYDNIKVEKSLLKRALGYDLPVEEFEEVKQVNPVSGELEVTATKNKRTTKHIPGDVTAQAIWLNNRNPKRWKQKRNSDSNGTGKAQIVNNIAIIHTDKEHPNDNQRLLVDNVTECNSDTPALDQDNAINVQLDQQFK